MQLEKVSIETFAEHLNTRFRTTSQDGASLEVELIEAKPGRSTPRQDQFALLFRGPQDVILQQGMFRLEHDQMGAFDLFLVPVRTDEHGFYYEAVFNRLLE